MVDTHDTGVKWGMEGIYFVSLEDEYFGDKMPSSTKHHQAAENNVNQVLGGRI